MRVKVATYGRDPVLAMASVIRISTGQKATYLHRIDLGMGVSEPVIDSWNSPDFLCNQVNQPTAMNGILLHVFRRACAHQCSGAIPRGL